MEITFTRNNRQISYTVTVKYTLFGTIVDSIQIDRKCGKEECRLKMYASWGGKVRLKLRDDEFSEGFKAFVYSPEEILRRFPIAEDFVKDKSKSFELNDGLNLKTDLEYAAFIENNAFVLSDERLSDEIERIVRVAHYFKDEYRTLKKSRFWNVVNMILMQKEQLDKDVEKASVYRTIFIATRFLSMMMGNGDIGVGVAAGGGVAGLTDGDFSQWLDSVEIDGHPDLSPGDKMDYLMQEDDGSGISFTGHTALHCTVCGCPCYRPCISGDNSTAALCKCGHTCAQHEWS